MVALIKTLMALRGMNQSDLVVSSGVSKTSLSRYLNNDGELRAEGLLLILTALGTDVSTLIKKEISRYIGEQDEHLIGEDLYFLLEKTNPITRRTIIDTLISRVKNDKNTETSIRVKRINKYREKIKTVRRQPC